MYIWYIYYDIHIDIALIDNW